MVSLLTATYQRSCQIFDSYVVKPLSELATRISSFVRTIFEKLGLISSKKSKPVTVASPPSHQRSKTLLKRTLSSRNQELEVELIDPPVRTNLQRLEKSTLIRLEANKEVIDTLFDQVEVDADKYSELIEEIGQLIDFGLALPEGCDQIIEPLSEYAFAQIELAALQKGLSLSKADTSFLEGRYRFIQAWILRLTEVSGICLEELKEEVEFFYTQLVQMMTTDLNLLNLEIKRLDKKIRELQPEESPRTSSLTMVYIGTLRKEAEKNTLGHTGLTPRRTIKRSELKKKS